MWYNSNELLGHTLRKIRVAVITSNSNVEIILMEHFSGDTIKIREICDFLEVRDITEIVREVFSNFDIDSEVIQGVDKEDDLDNKESLRDFYHPLIWKLTLRKRK